jgi:hypothetical protein
MYGIRPCPTPSAGWRSTCARMRPPASALGGHVWPDWSSPDRATGKPAGGARCATTTNCGHVWAQRKWLSASGAAWQYYLLSNGDFCTNPFYAACPRRMACARCEFHLPAESQVATALLAKEGLQHMLLEMPLDEDGGPTPEAGKTPLRGPSFSRSAP